jgi:signal transduction histidine kinase
LLALPLISRGVTIGVMVLEDRAADRYGPAEVELLSHLTRSAAVEIDNARWFKLLRTVGADEERNRIARDLHDRIGQALAYLGFELDSVLAKATNGQADPEALGDDLRRLRSSQREVVQEVRNALYDLRTEASDEEAPADVLQRFADRVGKRSGLVFALDLDPDLRLPARQERELWRIAQEAMVNVERHARATSVTVTWGRRDGSAELRVLDDGQGFTPGQSGRRDSYGLLGMRERASAIGATLSIERGPGQGTLVRCSLPDTTPGRARDTTPHGGKAQ